MRFGLRYYGSWGDEYRLEQIGGGGRIKIKCINARNAHNVELWTRPPADARWFPFETEDGQTYDTREQAEHVACNLMGEPPTTDSQPFEGEK